MTALTQYDRLECAALWRASGMDQRREVVAQVRATSLVLSDPKSDMALAHWSLPAIRRQGSGLPALYCPGNDDLSETLELDDPQMIEALATILRTLERRKPHPGRLRGFLFGISAVALLAAVTLWLPDTIINHTATILPGPSRAELGQMALADLQRLTGQPCQGALGGRAASALSERLLGPGGGQILVMREGMRGALALPGGLVVLSRELVEAPPDAETAAGFALAALQISGDETAQSALFLRHAGLWPTLRLLVSGGLPEGALDGIGETLVAQSARAPGLPVTELLARFEAAGISPAAYASALTSAPEVSRALSEQDPFKGISPNPVLADDDWISLQAICFDN